MIGQITRTSNQASTKEKTHFDRWGDLSPAEYKWSSAKPRETKLADIGSTGLNSVHQCQEHVRFGVKSNLWREGRLGKDRLGVSGKTKLVPVRLPSV